MPSDDAAARKARAERLRKKIAKIVSPPKPKTEEADDSAEPDPDNPRQFIERKMRELDSRRPAKSPSK